MRTGLIPLVEKSFHVSFKTQPGITNRCFVDMLSLDVWGTESSHQDKSRVMVKPEHNTPSKLS